MRMPGRPENETTTAASGSRAGWRRIPREARRTPRNRHPGGAFRDGTSVQNCRACGREALARRWGRRPRTPPRWWRRRRAQGQGCGAVAEGTRGETVPLLVRAAARGPLRRRREKRGHSRPLRAQAARRELALWRRRDAVDAGAWRRGCSAKGRLRLGQASVANVILALVASRQRSPGRKTSLAHLAVVAILVCHCDLHRVAAGALIAPGIAMNIQCLLGFDPDI